MSAVRIWDSDLEESEDGRAFIERAIAAINEAEKSCEQATVAIYAQQAKQAREQQRSVSRI